MKEWKYLIGSADDFIGAPDWVTVLSRSENGMLAWDESENVCVGMRYKWLYPNSEEQFYTSTPNESKIKSIIAQRTESFGNAIDLEFCKANPNHPDCKCKEQPSFTDDVMDKLIEIAVDYKQSSKYSRPCKGVNIDVYDVLQAFAVTNPATQHAIKKLLCAGLRGHKDKMQDLTEALKSIERAIELEKK